MAIYFIVMNINGQLSHRLRDIKRCLSATAKVDNKHLYLLEEVYQLQFQHSKQVNATLYKIDEVGLDAKALFIVVVRPFTKVHLCNTGLTNEGRAQEGRVLAAVIDIKRHLGINCDTPQEITFTHPKDLLYTIDFDMNRVEPEFVVTHNTNFKMIS